MYSRRKYCILTILLVLVMVASGCTMLEQLKARDQLNKGVNAYTAKHYDDAIGFFQQAIAQDPDLIEAYLYLAAAQRAQFIPQGTSRENLQRARDSIKTFEEVLKRTSDTTHQSTVMANLAGIYSGMSRHDEAKNWYRKRIDVEPDNPEPLYGIATINWQLSYDETGMTGENVEILEEERKEEIGALVDEGIDVLKKALQLDSEYADAMQYLNLLYREKAKLTEEEEEKADWEREADKLALQALDLKRTQQAEEEASRKRLGGEKE